jgi:hypothetical protein
MVPIAQPYAQDTCKISSGPTFALGGGDHMFGIDFVELKKRHQIASPVALLCLTPQTRRRLLSYPTPPITISS